MTYPMSVPLRMIFETLKMPSKSPKNNERNALVVFALKIASESASPFRPATLCLSSAMMLLKKVRESAKINPTIIQAKNKSVAPPIYPLLSLMYAQASCTCFCIADGFCLEFFFFI